MSLNSFMVRCSEGFNGGLHQSFIAEVRDFNSQELRANVTSPVPRFTIYGLDPSTNYQVHVFAFNQKGRSEPLTIPCDDNLLIGGGTLPRQKRTKYEVSSCVQTLRQPIVATPLLPEGIPFPHSPLKVNSSLVNKRESAV
ncbi:unnamed protein product [Bemisia tabaci]|uniref:Fibronectin type-III domain-containing protein n=1 Tax=Bemisia tabaci TaxID=7038 RepID=A0A9P0A4N8_BEMTA|nr:unnamed protein product [Bemisia tabaci]